MNAFAYTPDFDGIFYCGPAMPGKNPQTGQFVGDNSDEWAPGDDELVRRDELEPAAFKGWLDCGGDPEAARDQTIIDNDMAPWPDSDHESDPYEDDCDIPLDTDSDEGDDDFTEAEYEAYGDLDWEDFIIAVKAKRIADWAESQYDYLPCYEDDTDWIDDLSQPSFSGSSRQSVREKGERLGNPWSTSYSSRKKDRDSKNLRRAFKGKPRHYNCAHYLETLREKRRNTDRQLDNIWLAEISNGGRDEYAPEIWLGGFYEFLSAEDGWASGSEWLRHQALLRQCNFDGLATAEDIAAMEEMSFDSHLFGSWEDYTIDIYGDFEDIDDYHRYLDELDAADAVDWPDDGPSLAEMAALDAEKREFEAAQEDSYRRFEHLPFTSAVGRKAQLALD